MHQATVCNFQSTGNLIPEMKHKRLLAKYLHVVFHKLRMRWHEKLIDVSPVDHKEGPLFQNIHCCIFRSLPNARQQLRACVRDKFKLFAFSFTESICWNDRSLMKEITIGSPLVRLVRGSELLHASPDKIVTWFKL
jgi:hypothetical protein